MSNSEKLSSKDVVADFNKAHSPADLNKAFTDSIALQSGSTQSQWNEALAAINAGVEMKRLGLENFTILGIGTDKSGNKLLDVGSKDGKEERLIDTNGKQYGPSADGKNVVDLKKNVLTDASATPAPTAPAPAAAAEAAPKTVAFGNHNRQMTVSADGSDAVYAAKKGDNLWSVAKDYLQQQGKPGSDTDVANLVNKIAKDNKIQNANHILVNDQIHIKPLEAAPGPAPQAATKPEVAPRTTPVAATAPAEVAPPATPVAAAAPAEVTAPAAAAQPEEHSWMNTIKTDAKLIVKAGLNLANQDVSPYLSGIGAKMLMEKYGVKALEAGLHGPGYMKVIAGVGLGIASAIGISEGINAASVAAGNESLSQTRILSSGLAGYAGMRAGSAIEGRFANSNKLLKSAAGIGSFSTEWSIYDLGKTNPFLTNEATGKNFTVGDTVGTVQDDLLRNTAMGVGGKLFGMGAAATGRKAVAAGKGIWSLGQKAFTKTAPTEADLAYSSFVAAH